MVYDKRMMYFHSFGLYILFFSVSRLLQHERIGEGFINDAGLGATNPHSTVITPSSQKEVTIEEFELYITIKAILQFFIDLLNVIGDELYTRKSSSFLLIHRWRGENLLWYDHTIPIRKYHWYIHIHESGQ
jgi:hypothetical protein